MDEQGILDMLLARLDLEGVRVVSISLVCAPETLAARLEGDVARGARAADAVGRGLERLPKYEALDTQKLDTTRLTVGETAEKLAAFVNVCFGENSGG